VAYIGIDRGIVDHWIYQDSEYFKVWFEMLYRARFSKETSIELIEGQLVEMHYSEFIFGRIKWSQRLKISERRLRTLLDKLTADKMIEVVNKYPKFTVYRIINYSKYNHQSDQQQTLEPQQIEGFGDQLIDQQATSKRPADDQQATTKEESKESNKVKKEYKYKELIVEIVSYLNAATGKNFSSETKETIKLISGRITDGRTIEQFKHVIDVKTEEWLGNEKTEGWLKPNTLFAQSNFESYLNQKRVIRGGGNGAKYQGGTQGIRYGENKAKSGFDETGWQSLIVGSPKVRM
jgi:uncharacterized phage protein (TIGR02220 family)